MKRNLAGGLILALLLTLLAGCGGTADTSGESGSAGGEASVGSAPAEAVSGGWSVNDTPEAAKLPEEAQKAFDEATEALTGAVLTPLACIGTQVVAGTNYAILCRSELSTPEANPDAKPSLVVAYIYQPLEGSAELTRQADFDFVALTERTDGEEAGEQLMSGWQAPEEAAKAALPEEVQTAWDTAAKQSDLSALEPMAFLASQVVAGNNYAILCRSAGKDGQASIRQVVIYADLEGNAEVTANALVDVAGMSEES